VTCTKDCELFDLVARDRVGTCPQSRFPGPASGPTWARSPDGRLWLSEANSIQKGDLIGPRVWRARLAPNPAAADGATLAAGREYVRPHQHPLRIEVDLGTDGRSQAAAQKLAGAAQNAGFTVGPGGWVLRVTGEVADTTEILEGNFASKGVIPEVKFTWKLVDSAGVEAWQATSAGRFARQGSKYFTKSQLGGFVGGTQGGMERTEYYDFGNRDMRSAIVEEILERPQNLALPTGVPNWLLKANGAYHRLPLAVDLHGK
jgi:hypothetical protein